MPDLLAIENLRAGYGEAVVLPNMSLRLPEGEVLAVVGDNGAGLPEQIVDAGVGGVVQARVEGRPGHQGDGEAAGERQHRETGEFSQTSPEIDADRIGNSFENRRAVCSPTGP